MKSEPWCLVLSGGGAKGVYHIGAWRALREMHIPVRGFVGNSIGAIVAAFLAGGKDQELERIGREITLETFLSLPEGPKGLLEAARSVATQGGLDTAPLRRLLQEYIDEPGIRASGVDLGIVTVNLSELKPRELFLEEIPEGSLVDYLMASSAFPGFALPTIEGKKYVDGGLWDNMPYDLARARGWRRIILVDVSGLGRNRRPDFQGAATVVIRRSLDMGGGALTFDPSFLHRFGELGYLDTLRAFGRLGGWKRFLRPDPELEARFAQTVAEDSLPPFPKALRHDRRTLMKLLDCAAEVLEVEAIRAWDYRRLAKTLASLAAAEEQEISKTLKNTRLDALVVAAIQAGKLDAPPYRYLRLVRRSAPGRTRAMLERLLVKLYPELPAGLAYFDRAAPFFQNLTSDSNNS